MSDPVTNAEIEDVLSSIRRLVSEDPGAVRRPRTPPDAEAETKFVLTPAHRVQEEARERREAADARQAPEADIPDGGGDLAGGDMPSISESHEDWLEAGSAERFDAGEAGLAETVEESAGDVPEFRHAASDEQDGGDEGALQGMRYDMSLEDRIAELEAAINQSVGEWEPDGSEELGDDDATEPLLYGEAVQDAHDAQQPAAPEPQDRVGVPDEPDHAHAAGDAGDAVLQLSEHFHRRDHQHDASDDASDDAFEAGEAEGDQSFGDEEEDEDAAWAQAAGEPESDDDEEPDQAAVEDYRPDLEMAAESPADEAGNSSAADTESWFSAATAAREDIGGADEASVLDEDALREMVAEIVREELQGVFGERITRNIRRLVRREVQRALSLHDMGQ